MLENKDYCNHDTCVALEELGFSIRRIKIKGEEKHVPILLYEAQKWLREEKGIIVDTIINYTTQEFDYLVSTWTQDRCRGNEYTTYENALLRGIKEAVKKLKGC